MIMKVCKDCGPKDDSEFYTTSYVVRGVRYTYLKARCATCHNKYVLTRISNNRPKRIYRMARLQDRKAGQVFNLTEDAIRQLIAKPCHWCDENEITMTLDRLNGALGHVIENVVQSCLRCNLTRGTMPLVAWTVVAKAMKEARIMGLFSDWIPPSSSTGKYPIR